MRRMIRADLARIMRKKGVWVLFALTAVYFTLIVLGFRFVYAWAGDSFTYAVCLTLPVPEFFFGLCIFLWIYGDDFASMSMITAIGRGLTKTKVVLAKFLDTLILTILFHCILIVILTVIRLASGTYLTPDEAGTLYLSVVNGAYQILGYVTISAIPLYLFGSLPAAVFVMVVIFVLIPAVFSVMTDTTLILTYHIERYYYGNIGDMAVADIMLGLPGKGALLFLAGLIIYAGTALAACMVFFKLKETEF